MLKEFAGLISGSPVKGNSVIPHSYQKRHEAARRQPRSHDLLDILAILGLHRPIRSARQF